MSLDEACAAARRRVHALVDARHYAARRETSAMAESARRSIGQRFRYLQAEMEEARANREAFARIANLPIDRLHAAARANGMDIRFSIVP